MPKLVRLYIQSVAIGFALSAAFAAVMIWSDVSGVGRLILQSEMGWLAAVMLVVFNGIVFAGVQFAIRIMLMAERDDGPKGGLRQHATRVPARVEVTARPAGSNRR